MDSAAGASISQPPLTSGIDSSDHIPPVYDQKQHCKSMARILLITCITNICGFSLPVGVLHQKDGLGNICFTTMGWMGHFGVLIMVSHQVLVGLCNVCTGPHCTIKA